MTKAELIERIARSRNLSGDVTKKRVGEILDVAFDELAAYFAKGKITKTQTPRFTFPGFGTFTKKRRSARKGVHPRTLEPIEIDATSTLDFKVSSNLREQMNTVKGASRASGKSGNRGGASKRGTSKGRKPALVKQSDPEVKPEAKPVSLGKRKLRSREEVEMDAGFAEFAELPEGPLGRAQGRSRDLAENSG